MRLTAAHRRGALTPALPVPHAALDKAGLRLRRGQVSLTVAAPGVGKSQLWNNIAQRMQGVPTIYWSADTDTHDVLMRSMAMWSGSTLYEVEQNRHEAAWANYYTERLARGRHVEWIFEPAITPDGVSERLAAFAEVHGEYPHLLVTDNLSNIVEHQTDEFAEQKGFVVGMQRLARTTKTHIAILAHAKGIYEDGMKPIPQSGVINNLMKYVEAGVTMHWMNDDATEIGVNIVKNRGGKADPGAKHPIRLAVDYSRAVVQGFEPLKAAA